MNDILCELYLNLDTICMTTGEMEVEALMQYPGEMDSSLGGSVLIFLAIRYAARLY